MRLLRSAFSMLLGETFLPPAVMIRSFFRSVMRRYPSLIELTDVTGVQPTVLHGVGIRRGILVVPREHDVPAHQDLAVGRDPQLHAGDNLADRTDARVAVAVERGHRHVLAHPVAFEYLEPDPVEETQEVHADRRRAGDERVRAIESRLDAYPAKHETIREPEANALQGL